MGKKKGILAAIAVPAVLLAGGAGIGLVIAKEPVSGESRASLTADSPELAGQLRQAVRVEASIRKKKPCRNGRACRQRPAKRMSFIVAKKQAEKSARLAWQQNWDGKAWNDFGIDNCRRLSRSTVACLSWITWEETDYEDSDYGSLYICSWLVTSRWEKKGRPSRGKKTGYRLRVKSDRARADCEYE